jgi:hypothetical protein
MRRIKVFLICFLTACAVIFIASYFFIHYRKPYSPTRPSNVPTEAVYIQGADGNGRWDWCWFVGTDIHCAIYTVNGTRVWNEIFIPYEGPPPQSPSEIRITQASGDGYIALENGTYLISKTNNVGSRRYLDFKTGKTHGVNK